MRCIARLVAVIAIASIAAAAQAPPVQPVPNAEAIREKDVLGVWVSVHRSLGGIGSIWNFLPDGKLEMSPAAIVETWYNVEGDRLVMPPGSTLPDAKPTVLRFRVQGDTLYQSFEKEGTAETRFSRVGKAQAGDPPIVGVWRVETKTSPADIAEAQRKIGHPVDDRTAQAFADIANKTYHEYTRDGLAKIRVLMRTISGTYDLASGAFSMPTTGQGGATRTIAGKFRVENGLLVLTQPDGKTEDTYIRGDATKDELRRAGVRYGDSAPQLDPP